MTLKMLAPLAFAAATLCSQGVLAQDKGFFVGGSIGQSRVDIDRTKDAADLTAAGLTNTGVTGDERDTGWKAFIGYRFNQNFAVEGGYVDLGKFAERTTVTAVNGVAIAPTAVTVSAKTKESFYFAGLAGVPLGSQFSIYGKLGFYTIKTSAAASVGAVSINASDRNEDWMYGAGVNYDFSKSVGVRAEWERFRKVGGGQTVDMGNVDFVSLGLVYKF